VKQQLVEGVDFIYNEAGYIVLTEKYHLERGFCCGNGCINCPYRYEKVPEPHRTALIQKRKEDERIKK
jgi:hypothetical protein